MLIMSGGQTGVDRAALDLAMNNNIPVSGWLPKGRMAEDGPLSLKYPLQELPKGYMARNKQNVSDSDGTLIIYYKYPKGGTEQTIKFCIQQHKPYLLVDAVELSPKKGSSRLREFVNKFNINKLNIAGPSASSESNGYEFTYKLLEAYISNQAL